MSAPRKRRQRTPEGPPPPPVVQRLWLQYAKTGRLRFLSHRDYTRVFERAIRKAGIPIAFSAGFTPHPKISWNGAAPTGVASEAEYVEIGLAHACDLAAVQTALNAALPADLPVVRVVEAFEKSLAERLSASEWQLSFPGLDEQTARSAAEKLLAEEGAQVERLTQSGRKIVPVGDALLSLEVRSDDTGCAIMTAVVRHTIPVLRPDDLFVALRDFAGLVPPQAPTALRLAQGSPLRDGRLSDPLTVADTVIASSSTS